MLNNNTCIWQAAVLVSCTTAGLMKIVTRGNVVDRWCSMAALGLTDNFPGKLFYVFIANMTIKPAKLSKLMTLMHQTPHHASRTQNMVSRTCLKIGAWYWRKVTNLFLIL